MNIVKNDNTDLIFIYSSSYQSIHSHKKKNCDIASVYGSVRIYFSKNVNIGKMVLTAISSIQAPLYICIHIEVYFCLHTYRSALLKQKKRINTLYSNNASHFMPNIQDLENVSCEFLKTFSTKYRYCKDINRMIW